VASHTQRPTTQCWPAAHAAPSPHAHVPSVAHPSERIATHVWHVSPFAPHAIGDWGRHVGPEQQPLAQVALVHPLHAPASHVSPVGHDAHAKPALPHASGSLPGRHTSPSQHPVHDSESQTLTPDAQR
jgi:hypothetical protein